MGTHGAAGARARALPPGDRFAEAADVHSAPRRSLLNLSDWPVSRRLFTVIVAAVLMGVVFGGLRVSDAEASASRFSQVSQLANLGQQLTVAVNDLQNERDATLSLLAGTGTTADKAALAGLQARTTADAAGVRQAALAIGSSFPANIAAAAAKVVSDTSPTSIAQLHGTLSSFQDEDATLGDYDADISDMIALADLVAQGASDVPLTSDVQALNGLALAKQQASEQRGLVNFAFIDPDETSTQFSDPNAATPGQTVTDRFMDQDTEQALSAAYDQEFVDEAAFQSASTPAEEASFSAALGADGRSAGVSFVENVEQHLFSNDDAMLVPGSASSTVPGSPLLTSMAGLATPRGGTVTTIAAAQTAWEAGSADKLDALQSTEQLIAGNIAARASQLEQSAKRSALLYGIITALVLLLVLVAAVVVARSLVIPLRRLRAGALNIASVQLPERVRMLSESPESTATMEVAPINVVSEDEIGQVARAFDQVHAEAVRLAGEQALLRSSFNAMFVNLSRRSQSLIERLARTIDALEQSEDDPDRLGSLFAMDHMVTRMRRNSENLLLLAGHENPRKWSDSIPLADVARAATSEIEQYNRVTLNIPPGIAVIGQAVSDVVHLIAELVENATIFSPKETQVQLTMQELSSGGALIEILDQGIGVSEARLTDMNFRLDNPPTIDVSVSRHMGLFAVARLAERHRVRVRLRPATPQGLSALVWLPESVIERTGRYSSVQSWSTQAAGSQAMAGARPAGVDLALGDGTSAHAQNGYAGAGAGPGAGPAASAGGGSSYVGTGGSRGIGGSGHDGNAHAGNGHAGNGHAGNAHAGNGHAGSAHAGSAHAGNGHAGSAHAGNGRAASGGRVPAGRETRAASGWFRGQVTGAPPSGARGGAIPFGGAGAPDQAVRHVPGESLADSSFAEKTAAGLPVRSPRAGAQLPVPAPVGPASQASQGGLGSQALPVRGSGTGRSAVSHGPIPRGPGSGSQALPQRSPDQARSRLAAFQRGTRRAEEQPGQTGPFGPPPGAGEGSER